RVAREISRITRCCARCWSALGDLYRFFHASNKVQRRSFGEIIGVMAFLREVLRAVQIGFT
ncbi:MAG: hypothetical protein L6R28_25780, partial [Planctomycetes bacterium]|nr:hypothetical protein [Planctomycetota bacterium]